MSIFDHMAQIDALLETKEQQEQANLMALAAASGGGIGMGFGNSMPAGGVQVTTFDGIYYHTHDFTPTYGGGYQHTEQSGGVTIHHPSI